jgi:hypothetical protein
MGAGQQKCPGSGGDPFFYLGVAAGLKEALFSEVK